MLGDDALEGLRARRTWPRPASSACRSSTTTRPTTNKNAIVCGGYRLLKVDTLDNRSHLRRAGRAILASRLTQTPADSGRVQRFPPRHLQPRAPFPMLTEAIPDRRLPRRRQPGREPLGQYPRVQGLRPASRRTSARRASRSATRIPACGRSRPKLARRGRVQDPHPQARRARRADLPRAAKESDPRSFFVVDSFAERVVDAVGAGDALLAYATLSMLADESEVAASILGSMAAALECERDGNVPVGPTDVCGKHRCASRSGRASSRTTGHSLMRVVVVGPRRPGTEAPSRRRRRFRRRGRSGQSARPSIARIEDVPLDSYDAVLVCIPDEPKIDAARVSARQRQARAGREAAVGRAR